MTYTPEKATGVSETGKVTLPSYSMLALTLIGIADAVYVAHGNYTGAPLWCPIIDGCNTVINSPYSRVFGTPMSYFGFIYYVFMFGLAARLAFNPFSSGLRFRAILYAALGAASSMYFIYLQLGIIRAVCSYCLISAVTSFLFFSPRSGTFKRPAIGDIETPTPHPALIQVNEVARRPRQNVLVMPLYRQRFFNIETVGIVTVIFSVLVVAYLLYSIW